MRKSSSVVHVLCGGALLSLAAAGSAQAQAWLTFDVQGSAAVSPIAITRTGNTIVGYYNTGTADASFLRTSDGVVSTFSLVDGASTRALSANRYNDIAGTVSPGPTTQGFLRTADGLAVRFSVDGSSFTEATGINDKDLVAGDYTDTSTSKRNGFVRKPDGKVTTFASPDGTDVAVKAINNQGTVVGTYGTHGFYRNNQGVMTTFRITANYVVPVAINAGGAIAAYYADTSGKIHGLVRSSSGALQGFNAPNAANGSFPTGINDDGIVVGWCLDGQNVTHGFALNTATSKFAALNAPDGAKGTKLLAIGQDGKMVGFYTDAGGAQHAVRANAAITGF
ncbi:MAG: hypothetical protein JOZ72_10085 [Alphaproteobacteria bacterium]|nr:hypothetical protein [Alphaproteobacteria bacterium]